MAKVSVLIVTWNNEKDIEACVDSVIANLRNIDGEVIVIDNNSTDNTYDKLKAINTKIASPEYSGSQISVHLTRNETNERYTKAMNTAIKSSQGKNIFLLNPDTILRNGCIAMLTHFLETHDEYAACCPKLMNEDGTTQNSLRNFPDYTTMFFEFSLLSVIFPRSRILGKWRMNYFDYEKDSDVNQPMAAAFMVKRSMPEKPDSMDDRFEMFFSDVDLCKRIIDADSKIRYIAEAEAVHKKGASVYQDRVKMIRIWNKDCLKYFEKHHNNAFLLLWLRISLKVSEIIRIFVYKVKKSKGQKVKVDPETSSG